MTDSTKISFETENFVQSMEADSLYVVLSVYSGSTALGILYTI